MSAKVSQATRSWAAFAFKWAVGQKITPPNGPVPVNQLFRLGLNEIVTSALLHFEDERSQELETSYRHSMAHNVGLLDHLNNVTRALHQESIRCVAIKGAAMLLLFPDLLDRRRMTDLDILVSPSHYAQAQAALRELGGMPVDRGRPITEMWSSERMFRFEKALVPAVVDLHRGLHHWPLWSKLANQVVNQAVCLEHVNVPTKVDAILVIAAHRARNGFSGDCRELIDLRLLLTHFEESDWENLLRAAETHRMVGAVYVVWKLSRWWGSTAISAEVENYRRFESRLGVVQKRVIERWAGPDERLHTTIPKNLPYLRMYASMPLATGRLVPAMFGLGAYSSSRVFDRLITPYRHRNHGH